MRHFNRDTNAAIPLLVWVIVAIGAVAVTGIGVWQITQRPDIVYNITDTGFSLAGIDVNWMWIIAIAAIVVIAFLWIGRRRPTAPAEPRVVFLDRGR